jgi:saccharopine dehydrogenase-like NADP-dependent oxidoreductase
MHNMLVIGLGKVGSLAGTLLSKRFEVTGIDKVLPESGSVAWKTYMLR